MDLNESSFVIGSGVRQVEIMCMVSQGKPIMSCPALDELCKSHDSEIQGGLRSYLVADGKARLLLSNNG